MKIVYTSHLMQGLRGQPNPPCDGCPSRMRCATQLLACREFTSYVHLHGGVGRGDREPTRARYMSTFRADDNGVWQ